MMPLALAEFGEAYIIRKVSGNPEVRKHLEDMGLVAGSPIKLLNSLGGNVIIHVKESRIAISKEMAQRIMV